MHDGEQLFYHLLNEMKNNKKTNYYFKFHPKGNNGKKLISNEKIENIFEATKDLNYYLSKVSKVIVTQSSVGYEAFILNIPVKVISLSNKINDSPLLDILENNKENKNKIEIDIYKLRKKMKIIITGGMGFIGSNLINKLKIKMKS